MSLESKQAFYQLVYHTLVADNYSSTAKALAKEASVDKKSTVTDNLFTIYTQFLEQKKTQVSKEESSSDSSDSSSSSESESEDEKPIAKAPVVKKAESSDSDSSDSEDEKPAKPVVKKAVPVKKEESSDSDSSDSEMETVPAKKVVAKKVESSSSESSDSEEEAKPAAPIAKKRKAEISDESSSASSSESESEDEKPKVVAKKAAEPPAKKQKAESTPAKAAASSGELLQVFVRGLPWTSTEEDISLFFENKDIESVELPLDETGRSSGTAIVNFTSRAALDAALAKDGMTLPGSERWLKITEGKPARKSVGSAPDAATRPEGCDTVFVGNLPWDVDEAQMFELFGQCGEVAKVRFATSAEDGSFKGFAHVQFSSGDSVDAAVQLYGTDVNGRAIRVDYAPPRNRESLGGGRGEGGRGRGEGGRGGRGDGGRGRGRGRGGASPFNKNKGTIGSGTPQGKKISFD